MLDVCLAVACCCLSGHALTVTMSPTNALVDSAVKIKISHARPRARVTVRAEMDRFGRRFESRAVFRADGDGRVDLDEARPESGSYSKPDGMGLFWSMMPLGPSPKPFHFSREYLVAPLSVTISASAGAARAQATLRRAFMSDGVDRTLEDSNGLVATLFTPGGEACRPGVLVLGGSDGGVPEEEAAVLASHGLVTLATAYFGAPPLPETLTNVPLETIQAAVKQLAAAPGVCPGSFAAFGISKGAELALLSASVFSNIQRVVAISPSSVVFGGIGGSASDPNPSSWSLDGQPLPFANGAVPDAITATIRDQRRNNQKVAYREQYLAQLTGNTDPAAVIPVERIRGPVLVVSGGDDQLWPSALMASRIIARLNANAHGVQDEALFYPAAGHQIGIPYELARAEFERSALAVGGTPEANEAASVESWPAVVRFLQGHESAVNGKGK
jgi:dienelactone hydrolase